MVDESMASLDALQREHEPAKQKLPDPPRPLAKGKEKATSYTEEDIPRLKQQLHDQYQDILQGTPEELPPLWEVNHKINLIDPNKQYTYYLPRCPDTYKRAFYEKLNQYIRANWWEPRTTPQAAPLLCVPKKNNKLRAVIDARQCNDNTMKDVTPLLDQEIIREDVAQVRYWSKINLADAYEQVQVQPEDVHKTAFSTIAGTYISNVVQQRDCNALATFQQLMTSIFCDVIGWFLHACLDNIFIYSDSIEDHEKYLKLVFDRLQQHHLYLKWDKCDLYVESMDCLGHLVDSQGIHPNTNKLSRICDWWTPCNYNDIQWFVGLINYVSTFLLNISMYTSPLQSMTQNRAPFLWKPMHQQCCKTPIIQSTPISKTQYGSYAMPLKPELGPCMAKGQPGPHADPQDLCPRNSHRPNNTMQSMS